MISWEYDEWPSGEPYEWGGAARGSSPYDCLDFHVDLGCGKVKKGRIGVDRYPAPGVNVVMDLNTGLVYGMPLEAGQEARPLGGPHHASRFAPHRPEEDWHPGHVLPFLDSSIESIISHHALEHIGDGFIPLIDDIYRVLKPGAIFRAIVPLFPSTAAVQDPDHKRFFMAHDGGFSTFDSFCGTPGDEPNNCWLASFSVPYTKARFEKVHQDMTALDYQTLWSQDDARELRVALKAIK